MVLALSSIPGKQQATQDPRGAYIFWLTFSYHFLFSYPLDEHVNQRSTQCFSITKRARYQAKTGFNFKDNEQ